MSKTSVQLNTLSLKKIYNARLIQDAMEPCLHTASEAIKGSHRENTVLALIDRMIFIQTQYRGIGLAACQIGINKRVCTVYNDATHQYQGFVNPRIVSAPQHDDNVNWDEEGCLSHPGVIAEVARYRTIEVVAQVPQFGGENRFRVSGRLARVLQHEIDHLNGVLFTDLMDKGEARNFRVDLAGQAVLLDATKKNEEHGYQEVEVG